MFRKLGVPQRPSRDLNWVSWFGEPVLYPLSQGDRLCDITFWTTHESETRQNTLLPFMHLLNTFSFNIWICCILGYLKKHVYFTLPQNYVLQSCPSWCAKVWPAFFVCFRNCWIPGSVFSFFFETPCRRVWEMVISVCKFLFQILFVLHMLLLSTLCIEIHPFER